MGCEDDVGEADMADGLTEIQLQLIRGGKTGIVAPAEAQQEANEEATAWHEQWGSGLGQYEEVAWPDDMPPPPSGSRMHC